VALECLLGEICQLVLRRRKRARPTLLGLELGEHKLRERIVYPACQATTYGGRRIDCMSELEELEKRIRKLSPQDLAKFRAWFAEFDHALWDRQIESDAKSGKLDRLVNQALADYKAGKAKKI
jgi:phytoene dehydrogenase-like protein